MMTLAVIIQEEVSKKAEGIFMIATEWLITNDGSKSIVEYYEWLKYHHATYPTAITTMCREPAKWLFTKWLT